MTDLELTLLKLYRLMFEAGQRAAKSKRPEVRDAYLGCAAMVAQECVRLGAPDPAKESPRGA